MLGYRTLFSVPGDSDTVLEQSVREFRHWLGTKPNRQYDGDQLEFHVPARFVEDATALLLREEQPDGSRAVRATLTEINEAGRWTTQMTTSIAPDRDPWVWIDVDGPAERSDGSGKRQWTSTPNLAKAILSEFGATDGVAELGTRPRRAFDDDLDRIIDMICDPGRRGLLFLAGTGEGQPLDAWIDKVASIVRDTTGLASAYVLDAAATEALMEALGPSHAVQEGTIRTYRAGADPASEWDGRRHRILGRERLEKDDERFLRKLLGWRARESALEQPLPKAAVRLDARLEAQTNSVLVQRLAPAAIEPPSAADATAPKATSSVPSASDVEVADPVLEVVREAEFLTRLAALLQDATGRDVHPDAAPDILLDLATKAANTLAAQTDLEDRFNQLLERANGFEEDLAVVQRYLEDEQLEHAQAIQDYTTAASERDQLRLKLMTLGHGDQAWAIFGADAASSLPDSFSTLLRRLPELECITFTGNPDSALDLETHDPLGAWAAKTWTALQAANGYALAKRNGEFTGAMDGYLQSPPPGRPGYSRQRHARDESEAVKANERYRLARVFPVPTHIDASGMLFMPAHFKIAQFGMISPRLHYHDATGVDGLIYVGFIGAHLPTKNTN